MARDTILGPFTILPVEPNPAVLETTPDDAPVKPASSTLTTNSSLTPPAQPRANPFLLFLILVLLLAGQGMLAVKREVKPNHLSDASIE